MSRKCDTPAGGKQNVDDSRRSFLRNSVYGTPLITALLVEQASAGSSKPEDSCKKQPDHWKCQ